MRDLQQVSIPLNSLVHSTQHQDLLAALDEEVQDQPPGELSADIEADIQQELEADG